MFYELYRDVGDIRQGGLWFDPEDQGYIEVIDLDSSAGVDDANLVVRGDAFIDEKGIREGAQFSGQEDKADEMVAAVRRWDPAREKFESLPEAIRDGILMAAEVNYSYRGMDSQRDRVLVIEKGTPNAKRTDILAEEWGVIPRLDEENAVVVSANPEGAVWKILKDWGVKKPKGA